MPALDRFVTSGQFYLSPGLAKIAPYPPCTPAAHYARAGRGVTAFWPRWRGVPGRRPDGFVG